MVVDAKKIKEIVRLKGEIRKKRITLYLDSSVYDAFKKACNDEKMSEYVEEMMREFTESAKGKK